MSSSMIVSTLFGADGGEGRSTATYHIAQEKRKVYRILSSIDLVAFYAHCLCFVIQTSPT
jgi:hypothetical protein